MQSGNFRASRHCKIPPLAVITKRKVRSIEHGIQEHSICVLGVCDRSVIPLLLGGSNFRFKANEMLYCTPLT